MTGLSDQRGRPMRDLRISVTDRCNLRCVYCMPREVFGPDFPFLPREELLTFEELSRLASLFVRLGVRKIRVTGGEPLLRRDLPDLVSRLAEIEGVKDLTLTTNGLLLKQKAAALKAAGLSRVTVSLDAIDDDVFAKINGVGGTAAEVLAGIEEAARVGLRPVKVNCVIQRGVNEGQVEKLARRFRETPHILRFIEYMDVGNTNGWKLEHVVPAREILAILQRHFALIPVEANYRGEVAERFHYADGAGEVGLITSVTHPFCGECSRARLSPEGQFFTCLFAEKGFDLRALLRAGATDRDLENAISGVWDLRADRYSEIRTQATTSWPKVEMSRIGG